MGIDLLCNQNVGTSIGVLSATRGACIVGQWPDNRGGAESICYNFNRYMIAGPDGPESLGDALYNSKFYVNHNFPMQHLYEYQNMYDYNLYGDPSLRREGATPQPTPTATPVCTELGVELWMPTRMLHPGDACECLVYVCNPGIERYENVPLFVILDVYGELFFAPSFGDSDHYTINVLPGRFTLEVLKEFAWPEGAGSAEGITWYAGMTTPEMTDLFGVYDSWVFGWNQL